MGSAAVIPPLPPGFKLVEQSSGMPPLPPGFKLVTPETPKAEPEKPGFFGRAYEAGIAPIVDTVKAVAERGAPAVASDVIGGVVRGAQGLARGEYSPYDVLNAVVPVERVASDIREGNYGGAAGTVVGTALPFLINPAARGTQAIGRGAVQAGRVAVPVVKAAAPDAASAAAKLALGKVVAGAGGGAESIGGLIAYSGLKDARKAVRAGREAYTKAKNAPAPVTPRQGPRPTPAWQQAAAQPADEAAAAAAEAAPAADSVEVALQQEEAARAARRAAAAQASQRPQRPEPAWRTATPQQAAQPAAESSSIDEVTAELQRRASIREARRRAAAQQQAARPQQPAAAPEPPPAQPAAPVAQPPAQAAPVVEPSMDEALNASVQLAKLRQPGESIADVARRLTQRPATAAPATDDLMGQMSASVERVQRGEKATPPEIVQGLEQASAKASGEVAENAMRVNRTARGNTAARQFTQPELDALAEQLPLLVDQADSPIWSTIAAATGTTVPTTRAGRLEMVRAIQRQQGIASLTAPPSEAMSLDEAMLKVAQKKPPTKRTGKKKQ